MDSFEHKLVSVIIPCYNQANFLGEAIESVIGQSYARIQVIVVDDGSSDNTREVAGRYEQVEIISQENRGLSAARNVGARASRGEYLVFLDADDRLMEKAFEAGVSALEAHPLCAFVSGQYNLIAADGSHIPSSRRPPVDAEHYIELLRGNYIGMHATVMYRRAALDSAGGFDTSLRACEDYDLYLRMARSFPVHSHRAIVAEYRQHDANMSKDYILMMETSLSVLRSQWKYVKGDQKRREAYKEGIRFWQDYCARGLVKQLRGSLRAGEHGKAIRSLLALVRHNPRGLVKRGVRKLTRKILSGPKALLSSAINLQNK
jgi:glycosyltransferase involved in cell wall biosynthesis